MLGGQQLGLFSLTSASSEDDAISESFTDESSFPRIIKPGWLEPQPDGIPFWHQPIIRWPDGTITGGQEIAPNSIHELGAIDQVCSLSGLSDSSCPVDPKDLGLGSTDVITSQNIDDIELSAIDPKPESLGSIHNFRPPAADSIKCSTIDPNWIGTIEKKYFGDKLRPYFYWRYYDGDRRRSKSLTSDWSKALSRLSAFQRQASEQSQ